MSTHWRPRVCPRSRRGETLTEGDLMEMEILNANQDAPEGEKPHRRRRCWTRGCQLTTVTTMCSMLVFTVFLSLALVGMNTACTSNPCDPHCPRIYRQAPNVTCPERGTIFKLQPMPRRTRSATRNKEVENNAAPSYLTTLQLTAVWPEPWKDWRPWMREWKNILEWTLPCGTAGWTCLESTAA